MKKKTQGNFFLTKKTRGNYLSLINISYFKTKVMQDFFFVAKPGARTAIKGKRGHPN